VEQAFAASSALAAHPVTLVISSPQLRALKTAAVIAEARRRPIIVERGLASRSYGEYEGRKAAEVRAEFNLPPEASISRIPLPGNETWSDTLERAEETISRCLREFPDETILFAGHGDMFRALAELLCGQNTKAETASPYLFRETGDKWEAVALNGRERR
jgi:probable phosphoglycerate mutase